MRNFLVLMFLAAALSAQAATGDTIVVNAHQQYVINWYGHYDQWAAFPPSGTSYSKILMKYTLSDPQPSTQWDYTTNVVAKIPTGTFDSTLTQYPAFTLAGNIVDTVYFATAPTYTYFFNSTSLSTDSTVNPAVMIQLFEDSINPATATDSFAVYPSNYYNYIYDTAGAVSDSFLVASDSIWILYYYNIYNVYEVTELFELGRVMTPYGSYLTAGWSFDYWFDVTDYAPLFHDSVEMSIKYDGYSNGYAFSVTFYMIEGTPPRTAINVRNVYPHKYYEYGISTNPIESYLIPVTYHLDSSETQAMMRVIPSGHSFGGALNCAEFCNKSFKLLVDGVQQFSKQIWRNDCGLNPIWHQGGTWIYDRSNWCPGSSTLNKDQELTPFIVSGDSLTLEMNLDPYTYSGGAGFNPGYILSAQLFTYGDPNFSTDATVAEILKPNADANYSRFNPICNNPVIVIKNAGADPLTAVTINYGIKGGVVQTFNWTGFLNFLESETVYLDSMTWGSSSGQHSIFEVALSNPNGVADQNPWNDTLRSQVNFTPVYPQQFRLQWKTNLAAFETSYQLLDDMGNILYSNGPLSANTVYNDTFNLAPGCYKLMITDSQKDGLAFFANNDGTGYARLVATDGTSTFLHVFQADFGTSIEYNFTVGFTTGLAENTEAHDVDVYPNPAGDKVNLRFASGTVNNARINIYSIQGKVISSLYYDGISHAEIDLSSFTSGMYIISISTGSHNIIRKLVKQ